MVKQGPENQIHGRCTATHYLHRPCAQFLDGGTGAELRMGRLEATLTV